MPHVARDAGMPRDARAAPGDAAIAQAPPAAVEAPPGGEIVRVAVTPAEDAALTVDSADEVRLWPALDGTRPPVVVTLQPPRVLALQRAGADFVACAGVAGGTFEVRLDARGRRLASIELPAFDGIAAFGDGFVTWQGSRLRALDLDGHLDEPVDVKARITAVIGTVAIAGGVPRELTRSAAGFALGARTTVPVRRVTAHGSDLAIAGDAGTRYLGYAFPANEAPSGGDAAHLASGGNGRWLELDAALQPVRELVPPIAHATAVHWLAGDDWLVESPAGVAVWTAGAASAQPPLAKATVVEVEPETRLVLLAGHHLARYAADRHALDPVAFTAWGDAATTAHLVSPRLAHGAVLAFSRFDRDTSGVEQGSLRWIRDLDHPERGETHWDASGRWPVGVSDGGRAPINAAGRGWSVVDDQGQEHALPGEVGLSPDGSRFIDRDLGARTIALVTGTVTTWTIPLPGSDPAYETGAVWLDDDHLLLVGAHGVATIDPRTGAFTHASSGWGFELGAHPHPASTIGHPLVADLAPHPDPPLALSGDGGFQKLVRDIAQAAAARITGWGPMRLDGAIVRVAWLQAHEDTGSPLFALVVEAGGGKAVIVNASTWGAPELQGPWPAGDPAWGTMLDGDDVHVVHTSDVGAFHVATKWIHGSNERVEFTRERGVFVATSDDWLERENTGHGFDETSGNRAFPTSRPTRVELLRAHSMKFAVSPPSADAATLAAAIHEIPLDKP
jgi:hypothetical protein